MSLPDINSYSVLGGELADYAPVVDPTTDLSAEASDDAMADVAQMTRTVGRAYVAFKADLSVVDHEATWGHDISVLPVVTKPATGHFVVTWPTSVTDVRGIVHALNLRRGLGGCEDAGYSLSVAYRAPNSIDAWCTRASTAALADPPNVMIANVW